MLGKGPVRGHGPPFKVPQSGSLALEGLRCVWVRGVCVSSNNILVVVVSDGDIRETEEVRACV